MISTDLVAIGNVSSSHHIRYVCHEVITFSILGRRLLEAATFCCESKMSVE